MLINFSRRATCDRNDILDFFKGKGALAERFETDLQTAYEHLVQFPNTSVVREDLTSHPIRFWLMNQFYIVLRPGRNVWTIIAILHCSRNISRELDQRLEKNSL